MKKAAAFLSPVAIRKIVLFLFLVSPGVLQADKNGGNAFSENVRFSTRHTRTRGRDWICAKYFNLHINLIRGFLACPGTGGSLSAGQGVFWEEGKSLAKINSGLPREGGTPTWSAKIIIDYGIFSPSLGHNGYDFPRLFQVARTHSLTHSLFGPFWMDDASRIVCGHREKLWIKHAHHVRIKVGR